MHTEAVVVFQTWFWMVYSPISQFPTWVIVVFCWQKTSSKHRLSNKYCASAVYVLFLFLNLSHVCRDTISTRERNTLSVFHMDIDQYVVLHVEILLFYVKLLELLSGLRSLRNVQVYIV